MVAMSVAHVSLRGTPVDVTAHCCVCRGEGEGEGAVSAPEDVDVDLPFHCILQVLSVLNRSTAIKIGSV